jgi:hypothetical protein
MLRHTVELDEFATDNDMGWSSSSECSWRKPSCVDYKLERITSKRQLIFGSLWNIILSWNFEQLCLWGKGSKPAFRLFISMRSGCTLLGVLTRNNPEQKRKNQWIVQIQCTEESVIEEQMNLPAYVMLDINVLYSYRFPIGLEMHRFSTTTWCFRLLLTMCATDVALGNRLCAKQIAACNVLAVWVQIIISELEGVKPEIEVQVTWNCSCTLLQPTQPHGRISCNVHRPNKNSVWYVLKELGSRMICLSKLPEGGASISEEPLHPRATSPIEGSALCVVSKQWLPLVQF